MNRHKATMPTRRSFLRVSLTHVLVMAAVLAVAAVTVVSRQKANATEADEAAMSAPSVKQPSGNFVTVKVAGQEVQVDGRTGRMKKLTPEEAQKLAAGLKRMVNQSTEGLVQVQHADGSVSMDLEGRFQNVAVARVSGDGDVTKSCVHSPQAAGAFFGIDPKLIEQSNTRPVENQPRP